MNKIVRLTLEALGVGLCAVLIGMVVHVLFGYHSLHANSPRMKSEMIQLGVTLFFTGFFFHLLFEGLGLNRMYCQQQMGNKCGKQ
jgi:hypothetical protein